MADSESAHKQILAIRLLILIEGGPDCAIF